MTNNEIQKEAHVKDGNNAGISSLGGSTQFTNIIANPSENNIAAQSNYGTISETTERLVSRSNNHQN